MFTRRQFLKMAAGAGAGLLVSQRWAGGARLRQTVRAEALADFLIDPALQPKFVNPVPNPLAPSFIYTPQNMGTYDRYDIGMHPIQQQTGLVDPGTQTPLITHFWGYGTDQASATFPGRTFEAWRNRPVEVQWTNNLVDGSGTPVDHLLPVDTSLHWAYSLHDYMGYTIPENGVPVVPHVHGGHTESDSDGLPEAFWSPYEAIKGPQYVKSLYHYDNDQEPGTVWYHDHCLGITRLNVYAGLAGFYILREAPYDTGLPDNTLHLPTYPYEIALAIQDRMFTHDGELFYPAFPGDPAWADFITGEGLADEDVPQPSALAEFFGDIILVNGVAWPKMDVEQRQYRIRLLNGSDSRFYALRLVRADEDGITPRGEPITFYQIGTDLGLLRKPWPVDTLVLGPGERADLIVRFAGLPLGTRLILENLAPDAPFGGEYGEAADPDDFFPDRNHSTRLIMAFDVVSPPDPARPDTFNLYGNVRPGGLFRVSSPPARVRRLALFEGLDEYGRLQPLLGVAEPTLNAEGEIVDRSLGWFEPITEDPGLNDVEIWEIYNTTPDAHPIHVHLVTLEVLSRQEFTGTVVEVPQPQHNGTYGVGGNLENIQLVGDPIPPDYTERGPKDTVKMLPGQVTRIKMRFDRPGRYVWHCHILSHEDHEMMRPYHVGPSNAAQSMNPGDSERLAQLDRMSAETGVQPVQPTMPVKDK